MVGGFSNIFRCLVLDGLTHYRSGCVKFRGHDLIPTLGSVQAAVSSVETKRISSSFDGCRSEHSYCRTAVEREPVG